MKRRDFLKGAAAIAIAPKLLGGLPVAPAAPELPVFPTGAFIYQDGGVLELGILRDTVYDGANDFKIFSETFEGTTWVTTADA